MTKRTEGNTEVATSDLKALLWWAAIGVSKSNWGSYQDIVDVLESYAEHLKFTLPYKSVAFGKTAKEQK
jgi:hypothetical protein